MADSTLFYIISRSTSGIYDEEFLSTVVVVCYYNLLRSLLFCRGTLGYECSHCSNGGIASQYGVIGI